jgi:CubicO group peptidase (beta-lactamase class C family)
MIKHILAALCVASAIPAQSRDASPTKGWPVTTSQAAGISQAVLDSVDAEIKAGRYGHVDRILVIRRGRVVWDKSYVQDYDAAYGDSARTRGPLNSHDVGSAYNYFNAWWHPYYRRGDLHSLQSVTKTITSVVIGTAVLRGDFPSLDTPVLSFFVADSVANVDDRKRRMTIKHLLTMTDGFEWNEAVPYNDPRNTTGALEAAYDWIKFTIDKPMAVEPGTRWNYNSGASQLLAYIFRKATQHDIEEYAARHLFAPLGIQRWYWKRTPAGVIDTEGGLYLAAPDLAKIWYLFTKDGLWDGKQVVSREWVRASVTPAFPNAQPRGTNYGYKWWLYPHPVDTTKRVWAGSGFGGQAPMALPDEELIVVFNAWNVLPGRPALPARRTLARIVAGMKN